MKPPAAKANPIRRAAGLALTWLVAYFAVRAALAQTTSAPWTRTLLAFAPVPIFAAFLLSWVRVIRAMDELERKIHLESLAIAFSLALLLLTTLALLQRAVTLSFEDWSYAHVWIYLPIFYFLAIPVISRRYASEE